MHFDLQPGQVIDGKYEVRHKLGQGGMGAVYLVQHLALQREQALKLIQTSDADDGWDADEEEFIAEMLARFTRETQTLAKFAHPNIIFATDAGTLEVEVVVQRAVRRVHMPFLVMEFFDGHEGKKWTVREQPSAQRVLGVARQLAQGLACAHNAGVLHRDLKPQNILIGKNDVVKIVDFGLAKPEGGQADLTRTKSSLAGTLAYLAPEYAAGSAARRQHTQVSDLWALGCCFYFFLTHKNVFTLGRDENDWELLARVGKGEYTPVSDLRQDLSPEFLAVMNDLLQRDPARRMPSANELVARLERIGRADDPAQPPFVPPRRKELQPGPSASSPTSGTDLFSAKPAKVAVLTPAPKIATARNALLDDLPTTGAATAAMRPAPRAAPAANDSAANDTAAQDTAARDTAARDRAAMHDALQAALPQDFSTESMSAVRDASLKSARERPPMTVPGDETLLRAMEAEVAGSTQAEAAVARSAPSSQAPRQPRTAPLQQLQSEPDDSDQPTPSAASVRLPTPSFQAPASVSLAKEQKARSALLLPAAAVTVLGVCGALLLLTTGAGTDDDKPASVVDNGSSDTGREQEKRVAQAEAEMRALEQERRKQSAADKQRQTMLAAAAANPPAAPTASPPLEEASGLQPPAPAAQPARRQPGASDRPVPAPIGAASTASTASTAPTAPTAPTAGPTGGAASPWARFGSRPSTNTGAAVAGTATTTSPGGARTVGVRIPVRVNVELSSAPSGPVIAVVTQATDLGDVSLPAGTEIHGQTSGAQSTRLTINFTTAIVNGRNVPLSGTALGLDGKAGLPGVRAGGNGSDVAAAAAAGAVGALGAGVAAALGEDNAGGAAVREGAGAATQNTQRINTSQDIVMTKKGARFLVYVTR